MEVFNGYTNPKIFTCSYSKTTTHFATSDNFKTLRNSPFAKNFLPFHQNISKTNLAFYQIALIHLLDKLTYLQDEKDTTAISLITINIKKAFDTVDYKLLLNKLSYLMPHNILLLVKSYLSNRYQRVCVKEIDSENLPIKSGVAQGSVLSSVLVYIFINYLEINGV